MSTGYARVLDLELRAERPAEPEVLHVEQRGGLLLVKVRAPSMTDGGSPASVSAVCGAISTRRIRPDGEWADGSEKVWSRDKKVTGRWIRDQGKSFTPTIRAQARPGEEVYLVLTLPELAVEDGGKFLVAVWAE